MRAKLVDCPRARTELLISELDGEALIYDSREHRAHCLAELAYRVLLRSDGKTRVRDLANSLDADAAQIETAIEQLRTAGLLQPARRHEQIDLGRRRAAARLARTAAMAIAAPMVWSIVAPSVAQAASTTFCVKTCIKGVTNGQCCGNSGSAAGTCNNGGNCSGGGACRTLICR
jgi:hypothetical protein